MSRVFWGHLRLPLFQIGSQIISPSEREEKRDGKASIQTTDRRYSFEHKKGVPPTIGTPFSSFCHSVLCHAKQT
ncbi:hypothetical protein N231_09710 [Geobacillus stearothermophilus ATCC 12980]|uniref:Uncharacterized protein n=1 Tax=Geobacillus stearothermophilus TaxID=1422 RepID=A0A0K9I077_GEOSE|nr:hypothetical protein GS8_1221 [Geobacillus stearothermophilus]KOR93952.1 hypothetical protein N231_09710 [Geobacillus stearothermophilus ATCC 12980]KMY61716.1 hypothetical protein AA905_08200 [Geobacillus stearothermophilus]KMY62467.1 hypothetical protein AA906_01935 [Geobacillus stearothermophilus]KMY64675.1 hypothetical protein AA904_00165 [Geobacillus stearothermophilus]